MPTTKMITYNDFSKGDWGDLGEFHAAPGTFQGLNVVVYTNGLIGPRAGLAVNEYIGAVPNGRCWGIWHIGQIGRPLMISVEDDLYSTTEDNDALGTMTLEHTLDAVPTRPLVTTWYDPNGEVYISNPEDSCYVVDMTANTINNLPVRNAGTENAGTDTLYLCRDRLYAAGDGHQTGGNGGQYVYVSAAADFTNFAGGETFQVGYYNAVRGIVESQNSLLFSSLESTNNLGSGVGWYALTPATPQGDLRRINTQVGTEGQFSIVNAEGNNVYFWTGWTAAAQDNPYLVQTNGAKFDDQKFKHIRLGGTNRFGYYNAPDQTLAYISNEGTAWIRQNDAWTRHEFEVDVSGPICPTARGDSFLLPHGDIGVDLTVYQLGSRNERPLPTGFAVGMPGDASDTPFNAYFYLPAYQTENKEVRVRRVIVDFMKWNCALPGGSNSFTVGVKTFGQYNLPDGTSDGTVTTTATFTEDQDAADINGTLDRYVARIGQQGKAAAFQVQITGIIGCAIKSITVEFDEDDPDGRTI